MPADADLLEGLEELDAPQLLALAEHFEDAARINERRWRFSDAEILRAKAEALRRVAEAKTCR